MDMSIGTRLYPLRWNKSLIPVGLGYRDEDEFFLQK